MPLHCMGEGIRYKTGEIYEKLHVKPNTPRDILQSNNYYD